jgi:hypothetical protein
MTGTARITSIVMILLLSGCAAVVEAPASLPATDFVPVSWNGPAGRVKRFIAFRASSFTEWASLWEGLLPETPVPFVDFAQFDAAGLVFPITKRPTGLPIQIDPSYQSDDDSISLTYAWNFHGLGNPQIRDASYAIVLLPKSEKRIVFRPADSLKELPQYTVFEANPLQEESFERLPQLPLHLGGGGSSGNFGYHGHPTRAIETFHGSPSLVSSGDRQYALAHVMVATDAALGAEFKHGGGGPTDLANPDGSVTEKWYEFETAKGPVRVGYFVDGRNQEVRVNDAAFDLRAGNFVRINLRNDLSLEVVQKPIVRTNTSEEDLGKYFE